MPWYIGAAALVVLLTLGAYRIPSHGEVGRALADGLFIYWRGVVTEYAPL